MSGDVPVSCVTHADIDKIITARRNVLHFQKQAAQKEEEMSAARKTHNDALTELAGLLAAAKVSEEFIRGYEAGKYR